MVHGFGQGHLDRQLLVAPERAQSALPPRQSLQRHDDLRSAIKRLTELESIMQV